MTKKAIILDLDNTVYLASSIANEVFKSLHELIINSREHDDEIDSIKNEITKKPFQKVAKEFNFSEKLTTECIQLLENLTYNKPISPFEDYVKIKDLPCKKYLVTTGFVKLQQSKIKHLGIEKDFEEIHIVDPTKTQETKKDIFKSILDRNNYLPKDVVVVGDDINSEIQAAIELGIDAVLYNKININHTRDDLNVITDYEELIRFINKG